MLQRAQSASLKPPLRTVGSRCCAGKEGFCRSSAEADGKRDELYSAREQAVLAEIVEARDCESDSTELGRVDETPWR